MKEQNTDITYNPINEDEPLDELDEVGKWFWEVLDPYFRERGIGQPPRW